LQEKIMHEIKAVIQPQMLSKVMRALHDLPHFPGCTVTDVRGQGRGRGAGGSYKVTEDDIDYHRKVQLEIVCADEQVPDLTNTILTAARTGHHGDGLITVTELRSVIRIRTGEPQDAAV
jgi:nitrogen regulatory protein PII